jgi:hypothetical protein
MFARCDGNLTPPLVARRAGAESRDSLTVKRHRYSILSQMQHWTSRILSLDLHDQWYLPLQLKAIYHLSLKCVGSIR